MRKLSVLQDIETIKSEIKKQRDAKIKSRLLVVLAVAEGKSTREVAQEYCLLSHNQIGIWVKRFNQYGVEGLKDRFKKGRTAKMSQEQMSWLKKVVLEVAPTAYGYNTATWTAPLLREVIAKECGISYSVDNVYALLKKLGLSHKKGKGYYAEADAQKRRAFAEDIKKSG